VSPVDQLDQLSLASPSVRKQTRRAVHSLASYSWSCSVNWRLQDWGLSKRKPTPTSEANLGKVFSLSYIMSFDSWLRDIALLPLRLCDLLVSALRISDGRKTAFPGTCMLYCCSSYRLVIVIADNKTFVVRIINPITCKLKLICR